MFVLHALMDRNECIRLRRQLLHHGVLVCDLPGAQDGDPDHRRWLVGTFGLPAVIMTLRKGNVPVLYVDKTSAKEIDEEAEPGLSREESIDLYGAERVCSTASYKGSLMLAIAANEMAVHRKDELNDRNRLDPSLVEETVSRLASQSDQWILSDA